jgi:hypothetical protein
METLINTRQVAEIAGCSKTTVKRDAKAGKITAAYKLTGAQGPYLFTTQAAEAYKEARA